MVTIAFSARTRKAALPSLSLDELSRYISSNNSYTYNIIFGNERTGLTNDDLLLSDYLVNIETFSETSSLNLSLFCSSTFYLYLIQEDII